MGCEVALGRLVDFQFGALTEAERAPVEAHLVGCKACLESFLTLKRDVELGRAAEERPSRATRRAVFAAVAAVRARRSALRWSAVGALAAAVVVVWMHRAVGPEPRAITPVSQPAQDTAEAPAIDDAGAIDEWRTVPEHIRFL
jgi:hypothetical protein